MILTLLYGSESWTVYNHHANKINHFHRVRLRKKFSTSWLDKIPETKILTKVYLPRIHRLLIKSQLWWASHVVCLPDDRLPKQLFYGVLQSGRRSQSGQKMMHKDSLKASLKACEINCGSWKQKPFDRPQWSSFVFNGSKQNENKRQCSAEQRRLSRTTRETNAASDPVL